LFSIQEVDKQRTNENVKKMMNAKLEKEANRSELSDIISDKGSIVNAVES